VHRVVPNFVFQTGALAHRDQPLTAAQQKLVINQPPEFSDVKNEPGVVSMARGEDPASATTSFFVCTGSCGSLDGKYTAFARVSRGMDIVQAIATVAVDGETPKEKIVLTRVRVIGSTGSLIIGSSDHRVIGSSGHRIIGSSGHWGGHRVSGSSGHRTRHLEPWNQEPGTRNLEPGAM
jgi:cyclophilin family peptidyl-prolyl cis-trans isomerase